MERIVGILHNLRAVNWIQILAVTTTAAFVIGMCLLDKIWEIL